MYIYFLVIDKFVTVRIVLNSSFSSVSCFGDTAQAFGYYGKLLISLDSIIRLINRNFKYVVDCKGKENITMKYIQKHFCQNLSNIDP